MRRLGPLGFLFLLTLAFVLYGKEYETHFPSHDDTLCFYSNQANDNLRKTFTDAILQAKQKIVCIIYSLTDEEIICALRTKADQGIQTKVICDAVATQRIQKKLGPNVELIPLRIKGLMHNKLLAIDGRLSWLGSCNFTKDSLLCHANLVAGIWSEAIAMAIEEKALLLQDQNKKKLSQVSITSDRTQFELLFLPDDKGALDKVITLLQSAKKCVKVAMFTFTHPTLVQTLIDLHRKGIAVQVVIDSDSSRKTSRVAFERFKQENMDVRASMRTGLLHEKVAMIDDSVLIGGSANWTKAAFTANDEHIFIVSGLKQEHVAKLAIFWNTTLREAVAAVKV